MEDYEKRLLDEHYELNTRIDKLARMLGEWEMNELDFTPGCSFEELDNQLECMWEYNKALEARTDFKRLSDLQSITTYNWEDK